MRDHAEEPKGQLSQGLEGRWDACVQVRVLPCPCAPFPKWCCPLSISGSCWLIAEGGCSGGHPPLPSWLFFTRGVWGGGWRGC